jgi:hypothetical protein
MSITNKVAYLHVACTVLGDVSLRLIAYGKALTP